MRKIILVFLLVFTFSINVSAKKNFHNWVFGEGAWIKFDDNISDPYFKPGSVIDMVEGTASYSDSDGNLLFYSDGTTVYDSTHKVVSNGNNLRGHWSASEACFIFPLPNNEKMLYVITLGNTEASGNTIFYSVLDYRNGLENAQIINKNIELNNSYDGERAIVVKKPHSTDYWLILDDVNPREYHVYSVEEDGIYFVDSYQKEIRKQDNHGVVKLSNDGSRIISVNSDASEIELARFNPFTGEIYSPKVISDSRFGNTLYGVEFAPNDKYVYISSNILTNVWTTKLVQFDLESYDLNNNIEIFDVLSKNFIFRIDSKENLQLGPNNKIYVANAEMNSIGAIENPNQKGILCDYQEYKIDLQNGKCNLGLPSRINFPDYEYEYIDSTACFLQEFKYKSELFEQMEMFWIDPDGKVIKEYELDSYKNSLKSGYYHLYSDDYKLRLILKLNIDENIIPAKITASPDSNLCFKQEVVLSIEDHDYDSIIWNIGESTKDITVTEPGLYTVTVFKGNCVYIDSILIRGSNFDFEIVGNNILCDENDIAILSVNGDFDSYLWSTGQTTKSISTNKTGKYSVKVRDVNGCELEKEISVYMSDNLNALRISHNLIDELFFEDHTFNTITCKEINIKNYSNVSYILTNPFVFDKFYFSVPSGQFPYEIPPGDSVFIDVCFDPDSVGIFRDTLRIYDNCSNHYVSLFGDVIPNETEGLNRCELPWNMETIRLSGKYMLEHSLPYPLPVIKRVRVQFVGFIPKDGNSEINASLYNSMGHFISNVNLNYKNKKVMEKGMLFEADIDIDFDEYNLKTGVYILFLKSEENSKTIPIFLE